MVSSGQGVVYHNIGTDSRAITHNLESVRKSEAVAVPSSALGLQITKLANASSNANFLAELADHKHISSTLRYINVKNP